MGLNVSLKIHVYGTRVLPHKKNRSIKYESLGNINWYANTLASKIGAIVPQNLGAETQDKKDRNCVCW